MLHKYILYTDIPPFIFATCHHFCLSWANSKITGRIQGGQNRLNVLKGEKKTPSENHLVLLKNSPLYELI